MFVDTVKGLDKVFFTDITQPKIILVTGPPGSMKSSFCHSLLSKYLSNRDEFGLFATLEETAESHLANMESIGIDLCLNLQISDYTDLRDDDESNIDYVKFTERMIMHFKETRGDKFTCFAFDSLGALYSLMDSKGMRKKMYHFFKMLREHNLISFIIMERSPEGDAHLMGNEGFLSDGIIFLGLKRRQGRLTRYLQVEKMRATKHSMEMHALEVRDNDLMVLGPIFDQ